MNPNDILTPSQVAQMFQVTERTVLDYLRAGKIRCNKLGRKWHITGQAIIDYLNGKHHNESAMQATDTISEVTLCQSLKGKAHGTLTSLHQTEKEYATLLRLPTSGKRKSTTTA